MDNMKYSWASPQEDEFALLALGAPSPYEALLVPSLMRSPRLLLDLSSRPIEEQERWRETIQYLLRLLTVQKGSRIVLKSPPHGFKLPLLPSLFPGSRYVIIERNPYEVFASNLKLWQILLGLYSLESFSAEEIETFVLAAYPLHEEALKNGTRLLPPRSLASVRYEDLVDDPVGQISRLYGELELGSFEVARPRIEQYLAGVADHTRNNLRLTSSQKQRVDQAWGAIISGKRYQWPGDRISLD